MTSAEKKEILNSYRTAYHEAISIEEEIEMLRASKTQASAIVYDDMPKAHGNQKDLSDYIVKLDEMLNNYYSKQIKMQKLRTDIFIWCESLKDVSERMIIRKHYLGEYTEGKLVFKNFEQIAVDLSYTYRYITMLHGSALEHLPDINICG